MGQNLPQRDNTFDTDLLSRIQNAPWFRRPGKKGNELDCTLENIEVLLHLYNVTIRYNTISKATEIILPEHESFIDVPENINENSLQRLRSWATQCGFSRLAEFNATLDMIGARNPYNPIVSWIESKPWDGESRLGALFESVTVKKDRLHADVLIAKWLISCVAAVYEPTGLSAAGVLVFKGQQHRGKTMWFKSLFPFELKEYVKDGMSLDPRSRDSVMNCLTKWCVELGELDSTLRHDLGALKAFITSDMDSWRMPYARKHARFIRRTVFFASVNEHYFLKDPTGNRRFWTVEIESCNENHGIDIQQLWAEIATLYKEGEPWTLTRDELEMVNEMNSYFIQPTPAEELVASRYDWSTKKELDRWYTATEIALEIGFQNPKLNDITNVARAVRALNGDRMKIVAGKRLLLVPALVASAETEYPMKAGGSFDWD